mmetsp:Transcript_4129/g.13258  ORF Transcript_4129/g.13258 Transcript_4129/m.13258 type:complete len:221 (-) Transcript_4129:271-933(-)
MAALPPRPRLCAPAHAAPHGWGGGRGGVGAARRRRCHCHCHCRASRVAAASLPQHGRDLSSRRQRRRRRRRRWRGGRSGGGRERAATAHRRRVAAGDRAATVRGRGEEPRHLAYRAGGGADGRGLRAAQGCSARPHAAPLLRRAARQAPRGARQASPAQWGSRHVRGIRRRVRGALSGGRDGGVGRRCRGGRRNGAQRWWWRRRWRRWEQAGRRWRRWRR